MNIIFRELKANLKALIVWCIGGVALVYIGLIKYSAFSISNTSMSDLSDSIPQSIRVIFAFDSFDITKIDGYYGMLFLYFVLIGTIYAVMLGSTIISKEERDQTADFLFVKPRKRKEIITSKLIAGLINIIVLNLTILISSIVFVSKYTNGNSFTGDIIKLMLALFILQLIFFFIGTAISALTYNTKKATALSTAVLLGAYLLSIIIDLVDGIDFLKYIVPFKYYESKNIMMGGSFDIVFVSLSTIIVVVALVITYRGYQRHDFHV